jgi:hypothetical protein
MKFSDLDKNLVTEAEAFDKKQGKLNRMGTKLKSKLGPTKGMRQRATGKAQIQQQALDIKSEYMEWVGANDVDVTAGTLKQFLASSNYEHLADKVDDVAVRLEFKDKEAEPDKGDDEELTVSSPPDSSEDPDATGDKSKKINPPDEEADLELEPEDEVEEEVDMSASIYESRLAYLLIEDKKLKDNQLDTLLVRVLQAAGAGGKKSSSEEKPEAKPEAKPEKGESKYRKFMNKASKVAFGDLERANPRSTVGDGEGSSKDVSTDDPDELVRRWSKKVKDYNDELVKILPKDKSVQSKFNKLKDEYWNF